MKKLVIIAIAVIATLSIVGCSKNENPWLEPKESKTEVETTIQTGDIFNKKSLEFLSTDEDGNETYRDAEYNEFVYDASETLIKTMAKPGAWSDAEALNDEGLEKAAQKYLEKYYTDTFDDVKLVDKQKARTNDTNVSYILTFEREDGATFRISIWDNGVVNWSEYSKVNKIAKGLVGTWVDDSIEGDIFMLYIYEDGTFKYAVGTEEDRAMFSGGLAEFSGTLEIKGDKAYMNVTDGFDSIFAIAYDLKAGDSYLTLSADGTEIYGTIYGNPAFPEENGQRKTGENIFHKN